MVIATPLDRLTNVFIYCIWHVLQTAIKHSWVGDILENRNRYKSYKTNVKRNKIDKLHGKTMGHVA